MQKGVFSKKIVLAPDIIHHLDAEKNLHIWRRKPPTTCLLEMVEYDLEKRLISPDIYNCRGNKRLWWTARKYLYKRGAKVYYGTATQTTSSCLTVNFGGKKRLERKDFIFRGSRPLLLETMIKMACIIPPHTPPPPPLHDLLEHALGKSICLDLL